MRLKELKDCGIVETVLAPTKIICLAGNYSRHIAELKASTPEEPRFFLKPPSALIEDKGTIILPSQSCEVHHEVELGVIIGSTTTRINPEEAYSRI